MTFHHLVAAWLLAIISTAGIVCGVSNSAPFRESHFAVPSVPVVAIGSSLFLHGIPARPTSIAAADSLLGDGRTHVRVFRDSISEAEALAAMRAAVQGRAETVLLEVNPFAFDFSWQAARASESRVIAWARGAIEWSRDWNSDIRAWLGRSPPPADEPAFEATEEVQKKHLSMNVFYPLHLRPPKLTLELQEVLAAARQNGVHVLLVAPPRSFAAGFALGRTAIAALEVHLIRVAKFLDLPLFEPGPIWPNELFTDHAHLNRAGRARFLAELRAWWKART